MKDKYRKTVPYELPNGWKSFILGEIGDTYSGLSGKTKVNFGRGKPFISYMNIYSNPKLCSVFNELVEISENESQNRVEYGDFFFTTSSETADEVGLSSVLLDKVEELYLNSFCFGFRLSDFKTLLPEYAVYLLRGKETRKVISILAQGSTRFNLSKVNLLKRLNLTLPPLPEQQKIAEILITVDDKIDVIDQHISETQALKKGLMQRLLTKGIGHTEFKDSPLGEIPESWKAVKFGQYTVTSAFGPRFSSDLYSEEGNIASLRTTDLDKDGNINLSTMPLAKLEIDHLKNHILEKGDILISRSGTIGITAVFTEYKLPVIPAAFLIRFRVDKTSIQPEYIKYYFNSAIGRKRIVEISAGGVQKNLKGSAMLNLYIPIPCLEEQQKIANIFGSIDEKLDVLEEKKTCYQVLKQGLMQQLLTGKIRVNALINKTAMA